MHHIDYRAFDLDPTPIFFLNSDGLKPIQLILGLAEFTRKIEEKFG